MRVEGGTRGASGAPAPPPRAGMGGGLENGVKGNGVPGLPPLAASLAPPLAPVLGGPLGPWVTCRVQYLNDTDPFAYASSFPEPARPPLHCFSTVLPLAEQLAAVHRLLRAPQRVSQAVGLVVVMVAVVVVVVYLGLERFSTGEGPSRVPVLLISKFNDKNPWRGRPRPPRGN